MALIDRFPRHIFTTRGWGLLGAGTVFLLAAQVMGRRDLLALAILLFVLPALSLAGTRVLNPNFQVYREFSPASVETAATATVRLAVARTGIGSGHALMEERLPARFGESPVFRFPAKSSAAGGTSRYEYHLRSGKRGQFVIGPVTAEFSDPFGLSLHRHAIDNGDILTVTPAAVELPATELAGARGHDGVTATRVRANPSDDDVMTREYRHGDPMRRVHWAATARHGELMVRQEESVTTPEATIILDQRLTAFTRSAFSAGANSRALRPFSASPRGPDHRGTDQRGAGAPEGHELITSDTFEWAVTAAVSIGAHLAERNYALRFLDAAGEPAFQHSPSAPEPESEEYIGASGLQSVAESLAAIQLTGPHHRRDPREAGSLLARGRGPSGAEAGPQPFDDHLMDKLAAHRMRGPVLAILGNLTPAEARALSPAAGFAADAFALVITERARELDDVLETLRLGGWRAVAVTPSTTLPAAWAAFDQGGPETMAAATDVRRGSGNRP